MNFVGEFPELMTNPGITNQFKVGDKVKVDLEADILRMMQEGHGGWNPRMGEVCLTIFNKSIVKENI